VTPKSQVKADGRSYRYLYDRGPLLLVKKVPGSGCRPDKTDALLEGRCVDES
jgi:hypothetical protein